MTESPSATSSPVHQDEPDLGPEEGWVLTNPLADIPSRCNFVHDDPGGTRIRIRYYRALESTSLFAKAWFGPGAEGPPGHAHGGALMAVADEIAGGAAWLNRFPVLLGRFESNMLRPVPLCTVVMVEGRVRAKEGRKVYVDSVIQDLYGTPYVEATGLFVQIDKTHIDGLLRGANRTHDNG